MDSESARQQPAEASRAKSWPNFRFYGGYRENACWRPPGAAGHEVAQDCERVLAVLAGGVEVAADVEAVLGNVVAGQAAGDSSAGLSAGRTPRSLRCCWWARCGVSVAKRSTFGLPVRGGTSGSSRPGLLLHRWSSSGSGTRGTHGRARDVTARRNSCASGFMTSAGMAARPCSRAACQARIRPRSARCACTGQTAPGRSRHSPGSRAGCEPGTPGFRQYASTWDGSSSGTGLSHDPGEAREIAGLGHGVQAAGAQPERGVLLGERAVDVLLLPRPGRTAA